MKLIGSFLTCLLNRRKENSTEYEDKEERFTAKIVSDKEKNLSKVFRGFITQQTRLIIKTNDIKDVKQQDRIRLLGEEYLVESVVADTSNAVYALGAQNRLDHFPIFIYLC